MPLHNWTRVDAGRFHSFHTRWITYLTDTLNGGILPPGYYADPEQVTSGGIPDVVTLREPLAQLTDSTSLGGIALAEHPLAIQRSRTFPLTATRPRTRRIAVRHSSGDRVVAFIEIVSPANKDRAGHVEDFAQKVVDAISGGIHVLVIDLLPPGRHDPDSMAGIIAQELGVLPTPVSDDTPIVFASYAAGSTVRESIETLAVGMTLPEMPLFLRSDRYVRVPLESSYQLVWERSPAWRHVLETPSV